MNIIITARHLHFEALTTACASSMANIAYLISATYKGTARLLPHPLNPN